MPRVVRLDLDGDILPEGVIARLGSTGFQDCSAQRVTITSDGSQAICVDESYVRIWDLQTGKVVHAWPLPGEPWHAPAFGRHFNPNFTLHGAVSADGRTAIRVTHPPRRESVADAGATAVWNVATGRRLVALSVPNVSTFSAAAISPDGKSAATADLTLRFHVRIWDVATGAHRVIGQHSEQVDHLFFVAGGQKVLALVRNSEWLVAHDVKTGDEAYQVKLGTGHLHLAPNGNFFAVFEPPRGLTVYSADTGKPVPGLKYPDDKAYTNPRALADCGTSMLCFRDRTTAIWDFKSGTEVARLPTSGGQAAAFAPDGRTVVLAGAGLQVFDSANGKRIAGPDPDRTWAGDAGQYGWSLDGKTLCVPGQYRGKGYVFDPETGKVIRQLDMQAWVGHWFTAGLHSVPRSFFVRGLQPPRELPFAAPIARNSKQPPGWTTASGDERLLAIRTATVQAFNLHDLRPTGYVPPPPPPRQCADVAVHERYTGIELFKLEIPVAGDVAFSSDNRRLAVLEPDRLRVFDAATGKELLSRKVSRPDPPPAGRGFGAAPVFSPDNRRLAVNHRDGTVLIWDVSVGEKPERAPDLAKLWDDLGSQDASKAWRAVHRLMDASDEGVAFLLERVKPVQPPTDEESRQLLAELDSPSYRVRELAMKKVLDGGDAARPFVEAALKKMTGAELRKRLEDLWTNLPDKHPPRGDDLRRLRALHVLEQARTKEARKRIDEMAGGMPTARVTAEAKIARDRLIARDQAASRKLP
jgi:WD40 repeat protein